VEVVILAFFGRISSLLGNWDQFANFVARYALSVIHAAFGRGLTTVFLNYIIFFFMEEIFLKNYFN
jgi:hypothetical protein